MYDFLADLDGYFCEKYSNYDKLCILPGYRMPVMQESTIDEFGRTVSYTLPADTMRLALQENKDELLKILKARMADKEFSFSFTPVRFFKRIKHKFSKVAPYKILEKVLERYKIDKTEILTELNIDKEIWDTICKGKFSPTKNAIISLALVGHISTEDTKALLAVNGYAFDFTSARDVVFAYLLENKVFARPMMDAAFNEYKISNLFIK